MILKVNEVLKNSRIGYDSILNLESRIKELNAKGINRIDLDFRDKKYSIKNDFLDGLAKLIVYYNVRLLGLESKEDEINRIINSGYFLKKKLGAEKYAKFFVDLISKCDFPLLIQDNKYAKDNLAVYTIIQPMYFDSTYLYYKSLKTYLLEPLHLEKACWHSKEKVDIWNEHKILISDLGSVENIFRFPATIQEKTLLDIFSNIISGDLSLLNLK